MIVYFDSSAFVKLVVEKDGSDLAAQLLGWVRRRGVKQARLAVRPVAPQDVLHGYPHKGQGAR